MANFSLGKHPHVELCDLLKLEGWSESGAQAKIAIADGLVKVDGAVETRKRCKIVAGQTVSFEGQSVTVTESHVQAPQPAPVPPPRQMDSRFSALQSAPPSSDITSCVAQPLPWLPPATCTSA